MAGTGTTLFSCGLFWDRFFLDFRNFFGARFRYKIDALQFVAKPNCILLIGDDGSLNRGCSSSKLIDIKINMESEYNSNLQIGMALSIKKKIMAFSLSNIKTQ